MSDSVSLRRGSPRVPWRLAMVPATTHFGRHFRPDLFYETLAELPRLGLNGVLIVPAKTHGTPAGLGPLPFRLEGGEPVFAEAELAALSKVFDEITAHGQAVFLLCPAWIPPGFSAAQVRAYYDGKTTLPGYEGAVHEHMTRMLAAVFRHLPQVTGIVLHSLELPELWEGAVSFFPCGDAATGERVFRAYMDGLLTACRLQDKMPCFWSHVANMDGPAVVRLRELLAEFPEAINIEDHYWPNGGWPFLPLLGYLPEHVRAAVHTRNRFGLFLTTTDGEYYGGGKLPTADPAPHVRGAEEAAQRHADMVIIRLHEHDETGLGTLRSLQGLAVEAAARQLWDPVPAPGEVQADWLQRRFGRAAADVGTALDGCGPILHGGLTVDGVMLLDHEGIPPYLWTPGGRAYALFGKPGTPLGSERWDAVKGMDFLAWQMKSVAIRYEDYRSRQAAAMRAAQEGRACIENARERLARDDYQYLLRAFDDAVLVLDALARLGRVAYAANLVADNYDGLPDPRVLLEEAVAELETCALEMERQRGPDFFRLHDFIQVHWQGDSIPGPAMPLCLRIVARDYRRQG